MGRTTSHDTKDALDRARAEIRLELNRYFRRMFEIAELNVQQRLAFEVGDPEEAGREAAKEALGEFGFHHKPQQALAAVAGD